MSLWSNRMIYAGICNIRQCDSKLKFLSMLAWKILFLKYSMHKVFYFWYIRHFSHCKNNFHIMPVLFITNSYWKRKFKITTFSPIAFSGKKTVKARLQTNDFLLHILRRNIVLTFSSIKLYKWCHSNVRQKFMILFWGVGTSLP